MATHWKRAHGDFYEALRLLRSPFLSLFTVLFRSENFRTVCNRAGRKFTKSDFSGLAPIQQVLKSCRTKVPRILPRIFEIFRASCPGKRRPLQIHQKAPPCFNAKSPVKFKRSTKVLWRSGKLMLLGQEYFKEVLLQLGPCAA